MPQPKQGMQMPSRFTIVDLFAGPGGLDTGARQLGIKSVGIEFDDDACATRAAAGLATVQGDVRDFGPWNFPKANVLAGGPPCQTFTVAGAGAGREALDQVLEYAGHFAERQPIDVIRKNLAQLSDERTGLILEPLRWALEAIDAGRPFQAIVLEQVRTVLPVWRAFKSFLEAEGYDVAEPEVLHTEEFGVPQTRSRAILIARWAGPGALLPAGTVLPKPTHRRYRKGCVRTEGDPKLLPWQRMRDVLPDRSGAFEVVSNYGTGGMSEIRGRRTHNEPSATITGKASRNRLVGPGNTPLGYFSMRELGLLQTFPADYPWTRKPAEDGSSRERGSASVISQQIGNAVPPRLGMHVLAAALDMQAELAKALG